MPPFCRFVSSDQPDLIIELRDAEVKSVVSKKKKEWFEVNLAMHKNQRHVVFFKLLL